MNGAHLANPIRGELSYAHWPQLSSQIHCSIGNQNWGPLGKEDVCPNFALTVGKFVFSNSGNFRAKANPPKPRSRAVLSIRLMRLKPQGPQSLGAHQNLES